MFWILMAIGAIVACEIFLRLPFMAELGRVQSASKKSMAAMRSARISDHWKEKVLPAYAFRLGKGSILLFAMLLLALSPFFVLGLVAPGGMGQWLADLMRPLSIGIMCVGCIGYMMLRKTFARG